MASDYVLCFNTEKSLQRENIVYSVVEQKKIKQTAH